MIRQLVIRQPLNRPQFTSSFFQRKYLCFVLFFRSKIKLLRVHSTFGIKKTRDERGFGGKSLILERIPTLSHTEKEKISRTKGVDTLTDFAIWWFSDKDVQVFLFFSKL